MVPKGHGSWLEAHIMQEGRVRFIRLMRRPAWRIELPCSVRRDRR